MQIRTNRIGADSSNGAVAWIKRQILEIKSTPWVLPVIVWFAVVAWRPLIAGFYHDDWSVLQPLLAGDALKLFEDQASRPIYALIIVSVRQILPMDSIYYQGLLAILMACSALAIGLFAQRMSNRLATNSETASWAGAVSASIWLATPWDLGVSVWPTTFPAQISVIGFCVVGAITLGNDSTRVKLAKALPTFLAISLISELFWLSFIPLIILLIALGSGFSNWRKQREVISLFIGFGVIQVLLAAINRMLVFLGFGVNRSFNTSVLETTWLSLRLLPSEFSKAVVSPLFFWAIGIGLVVGLIVCALFHPRRKIIAGVLLAIGVGCVISIFLFALAGYRVESIGIFSRTTVVISVWLSLIPALAIAVAEKFNSWIKWSLNSASVLLLLVLASSSVVNLQAWSRSWQFQRDLLSSIPAEELIRMAEKDSFILVDADRPGNSVEGLEGFWDLSGALFIQYPALRDRFSSKRNRHFATIVDRSKKQTTWDGADIVQSWCHSPQVALWKLGAPSQVYLWNYSARKLTRLDNPVKLGCEKSL